MYANPLTREYGFSGSIMVARGDQIMLADGFGFADDHRRSPVTLATRLPIASATKPITATAVLMLEEDGRLELGDPICIYIPSCPRSWRPIGIVDLLDQTAGLPDLPATALGRPLGDVIDDPGDHDSSRRRRNPRISLSSPGSVRDHSSSRSSTVASRRGAIIVGSALR
jgi:CubicO group peptidase (beta-lactamase class C family)